MAKFSPRRERHRSHFSKRVTERRVTCRHFLEMRTRSMRKWKRRPALNPTSASIFKKSANYHNTNFSLRYSLNSPSKSRESVPDDLLPLHIPKRFEYLWAVGFTLLSISLRFFF